MELQGGANSSIRVYAEGSLSAVGEVKDPILFTAESATPGGWYGIAFGGSVNKLNALQHVTVEYGGAGAFSGASEDTGNLYVSGYSAGTSSTLTLSDSTFRYSASYGLAIEAYATVHGCENVSVYKNDLGDGYGDCPTL